mmetsp:Transcript_39295/g.124120  ORF Transcript_39295/g.124120 Transcript_39295/m.124120 type:complete len:325 (-) Transcript_39295:87-1061(-)
MRRVQRRDLQPLRANQAARRFDSQRHGGARRRPLLPPLRRRRPRRRWCRRGGRCGARAARLTRAAARGCGGRAAVAARFGRGGRSPRRRRGGPRWEERRHARRRPARVPRYAGGGTIGQASPAAERGRRARGNQARSVGGGCGEGRQADEEQRSLLRGRGRGAVCDGGQRGASGRRQSQRRGRAAASRRARLVGPRGGVERIRPAARRGLVRCAAGGFADGRLRQGEGAWRVGAGCARADRARCTRFGRRRLGGCAQGRPPPRREALGAAAGVSRRGVGRAARATLRASLAPAGPPRGSRPRGAPLTRQSAAGAFARAPLRGRC